MPDLILLVATAAGVFALAALTQAVSGFGGTMLAIPLLLLVVDAPTAIAAATGVSLVLSAHAWRREREYVDRPIACRLVVAGLLGMPAGLLALLLVEDRLLTLAIGALILVTVALTALRLRASYSAAAQWSSGVVSGALLTSTGMNGPPLVWAVTSAGLPARRIRATLQAVFAVQDGAAIVLFALAGVFSGQALLLVVAGCVGILPGWALGDRIFARLSEDTFRRIVLTGLVMVAFAAFLQSA